MASVESERRHWGEAPWRVAVESAATPLPAHVEIAIVGAGFTGLATAAELAAAGVGAHVLEAAAIGDGASGRSGGIALEGTAAGPLPHADDCLAALHEAIRRHAIAADFAPSGCWEVRHVAPAAVKEKEPCWPDGEAGCLVVDAIVPGGALDPGALVSGLARAALRGGAALHVGVRVDAWEPGPPTRLRVGARTIAAERVLLATNALLPALVPASDVRPALTLAIATAPLPSDALAAVALGATPFYTVDFPYLWGRATRDGRLVFGAGLAFDEAGDVEGVSVARADVVAALAKLERRARGLHPALGDCRVTHRWGGPIAFRGNRAPILAEAAPGVLVAGAYAGHGVAIAVKVGAIAARWLREGGALPAWGAL